MTGCKLHFVRFGDVGSNSHFTGFYFKLMLKNTGELNSDDVK